MAVSILLGCDLSVDGALAKSFWLRALDMRAGSILVVTESETSKSLRVCCINTLGFLPGRPFSLDTADLNLLTPEEKSITCGEKSLIDPNPQR